MQGVKRFYALDSFRGICALFVVVFHAHVSGTFTEFVFFRRADIFVEFFFVLSGFVLAHAYGREKDVSFRDFFISRTFRLLPLHWFMLLAFIVLELAKILVQRNGFDFRFEPFSNDFSPSGIIPNLLLIQSWTDFTNPASFNYPSWSISIEYYMYLMFMVVLMLGGGARVLVWGLISLVAFVFLFFGSGVLTEASLRGLSCFFAGALSYALYSKAFSRIRLGFKVFTFLEILLLFLVVVVVVSDVQYRRILASVLFCCVVIGFAFERGAVSNVLGNGYFVLIGKLSYSIYLTHAMILICMIYVFLGAQRMFGINLAPFVDGKPYIDTGSYVLNNLVAVCLLLVVIVVSAFTYKHVEVRGQSLGRRMLNGYKVKSVATSS
jgi:peptidoglycan/LPS O-acetylase OafA/YrhL